MDNSLLYKISLTLLPNIGSVLAKNLVAYCGSAEAVFSETKASLAKIPGIGPTRANDIVTASVFSLAEKEIRFLENNDIEPLFYLDDDYPKRLSHFEYSPVMLYYKGAATLNHTRTVGIVGTRKPTERGKKITEKIIEDLSPYDVHIISGLAYGVDGCAHKKSVELNIPTIGVMGNGHDNIYPTEHRSLAKKMQLHGGLLTEFCSDSKPDKANFPMRNRIIAALSDALIIIESKENGGSIISAEYANEYNKDVFAVPGRVDDELSQGCNKLIKQHKAYLLESAKDLVYIMRWEELDKSKSVQTTLFPEVNDQEKKILDHLMVKRESSVDEIIIALQMPSSAVSASLLGLEFKGLIRALPGKRYMMG
jgi:DNA processing protein